MITLLEILMGLIVILILNAFVIKVTLLVLSYFTISTLVYALLISLAILVILFILEGSQSS